MIFSEFSRKVDVDAEIFMTQLKTLYAAGDKNAHTFKLMLCRKGALLDIDGAGVIGYFIRSDGSTVLLNGEVDENVVTLTLNESCYAVIGQYNLIIKVTIDDERKAVFWGNGYITRSQTDKIIDPGDVVPSLEELLAQIAAVEAAAKDARAAANTATAAASKIDTMTVTATGLDAGSAPTAELTEVDGRYNLALGVPKGDKGGQGETGPQGPQGEPGQDAVIDATLTKEGEAADAKAAGEALNRLKEDIVDLQNVCGLESPDITPPIEDCESMYISYDGTFQPAQQTTQEILTPELPAVSGYTYTATGNFTRASHGYWGAFAWYDKEHAIIGQRLTGGTTKNMVDSDGVERTYFEYSVIAPSNAKYLRFSTRTFGEDISLKIECEEMKQHKTILELVKNSIPEMIVYPFSAHSLHGINHRGFNAIAPENTLSAYKLSARNGFSFVETDISFTADNVPVLLHDTTIDRTSNGSGDISTLTFDEVRKFDFGSWMSADYAGEKIPSFKEFLKLCKRIGIFPYIELKHFGSNSAAYSEILIEIAKNEGMLDRCTWISFDYSSLAAIIQQHRCARVGLLHSADVTSSVIDSVCSLKTGYNECFLSLDVNKINDDVVDIAKKANIPMETWTVNTESQMIALNDYISGATSDNLNFEVVIRNSLIN